MRDLATDVVIFVGAMILLAYGTLIVATRSAIIDDLNSLLGMPQKVANQQKPTLIGDTPPSMGNDIKNYVDYSYNGAIASIVIGVLQIVSIFFKYGFRSRFAGGKR